MSAKIGNPLMNILILRKNLFINGDFDEGKIGFFFGADFFLQKKKGAKPGMRVALM